MALHIDVCPELSLWLIEPCNTALDIALWPIVFAGQIIYLVHGFHFFVKNFGKDKNKELGEDSGKLLKPLSIGEPNFLLPLVSFGSLFFFPVISSFIGVNMQECFVCIL